MPLIEHGNFGEHSKTIRYPCPIKNVRGYTLGTVSGCIEKKPDVNVRTPLNGHG